MPPVGLRKRRSSIRTRQDLSHDSNRGDLGAVTSSSSENSNGGTSGVQLIVGDDDGEESSGNVDSGSGNSSAGDSQRLADGSLTVDSSSGGNRFPKGTPFLTALSSCDTLECLRDAHELPKTPAKYNFPHFLIIGFQKQQRHRSTEHPEVLKPSGKEPEFLSFGCRYNPPADCPPASSLKYINTTLRLQEYLQSDGSLATFEASTHIVRSGDFLAQRLKEIMPWVKLVISLREPISRAASMLIHLKDQNKEGCLMTKKLGDCLLTESQINGAPSGARTTNYSFPIETWLRDFPSEQVHIIQYEELTEEENQLAELDRLKGFIDVAPGIPAKALGVHNSRKYKIRPEGWRMQKSQYEELIDMVRPDIDALLDVMEKYGKIKSRQAWLSRWEQVWQDNLASCNEEGICSIILS